MADANVTHKIKGWGVRVDWACAVCLKAMSTPPCKVGKCCSRECTNRLARKRSAPRKICPTCSKDFASRVCGGVRMKYCCKVCANQRTKAATAVKRKRQRKAMAIKILVAAEVRALRRIASYVEKPTRWRKTCERCGNSYECRRTRGCPAGKCDCPIPVTENARKAKRVAKSMRRARMRGAESDRIDPIEIFDLADWACQICGRGTPRELRGTCEDRAPELDHIIPLAKGGTHTFSNVQCACRECNRVKSDTMPARVGHLLPKPSISHAVGSVFSHAGLKHPGITEHGLSQEASCTQGARRKPSA